MMKKCIVALFMLASMGIQAEPKRHHFNGNANKVTAIKFVDQYFEKLGKGMTASEFEKYWSDKKKVEHRKITSLISKTTSRSYELERRNILDTISLETKCEITELKSASVFGVSQRKASLKYLVNNTCTKSKRPFMRIVKLRYSRSNAQWVFEKIEDNGD